MIVLDDYIVLQNLILFGLKQNKVNMAHDPALHLYQWNTKVKKAKQTNHFAI